MSQSNNDDRWIGADSVTLTNMLAKRTIDEFVAYIVPILESLKPNFSVLDVGCGPGSITIEIARRYPEATVLGVDSLEKSVEHARKSAADQGVKNVQFKVGNAMDLAPTIGSDRFDVVHTHQVHVHVKDSKKLMRELRNATKPGGRVCCCEGDLGMAASWPETPLLAQFESVWPKALSSRGGDPYVGRKLLSHALATGFKGEKIETGIISKIYATPEGRKEWTSVLIGHMKEEESKQSGIIDPVLDVAALIKDLEKWEHTEGAWRCMTSVYVVCQKEDEAKL